MSEPRSNPIDLFFWSSGTQFHDKLVYYDELGICREAKLGASAIETALQVFAESRKAIQRHGGGYSIAEPIQMVLVADRDNHPSLQIKVKFLDLKKNPGDGLVEDIYVTHTKTVPPEALKPIFPFHWGGNDPQRFLVDFGQGAVPVHLFDIVTNAAGIAHAHFIELADLEALKTSEPGTRIPIQTYVVERDVLRFAPEDPKTGRPRQFEFACELYEKLRASGARIVPTCLNDGETISVPAGIATQDVGHFLRKRIQRRKAETRSGVVTSNTLIPSIGRMISFGQFEK